MRRLAVLALALVVAPPALAEPTPDTDDDDAAAYADDATVDLVPRNAKLRLVGRTVAIRARYELDVFGPSPLSGAEHLVSLPDGAAITAAVVHAEGRTQRLDLATTEEADKRLEALLTQPTRSGGRMSSVRIDAPDEDSASIDFVFPRRTHVRLDLTLEVPTCFSHDARHILIPTAWTAVISGSGTPMSSDDAIALDEECGENHDGKVWIAFASRELAKQPGGAQRIGTYGARLPLGKTDVARVDLALAKQVSEIPRDLYTVLVVDHSRSLSPEELDTQRGVVAAYLRAAPHGRVQLVDYARYGKTLLPGWMIASHASSRIDHELRAVTPRNGSEVRQGLATAASLLANVSGTRRIILFTDNRLALKGIEDWNAAEAAAALPSRTLVHIVSLKGFGPGLTRDDQHGFGGLPRITEGVVMRAQLDDQQTIDALALARPITFDNLTVTAEGWTTSGSRECPEPVPEGVSCDWLGHGPAASGPITIAGFLWGTKVTRVIEPDRREARSLARSLTSRLDSLPPHLAVPIQQAAHAVNGVWSLVAMWGVGGYGNLLGWGTIRTGSYGTTSRDFIDGIGTPGIRARDLKEEILAQLGPVVRRCKPRGVVGLDVELTKEEIVDVGLTFRDQRDAAKRDCIVEGIWDFPLVIADAPPHTAVRLQVNP